MKFNSKILLSRKSIIAKLFVSFLLLVLSIEAAGLFFLFWTEKKMEDEIENSAKASIHYLSQDFSQELTELSSQLERLTNNNVFTQFSVNHNSLSNSEYYTSLLEQYDLIKYYPIYYPIIDDITVYYPAPAISLSAGNALLLSQQSAMDEVLQIARADDSLLKKGPAFLFLSSMYPAYSRYSDAAPLYFFTIELSEAYILDYLDTASASYHTLLYIHPNQTAIFDSSVENSKIYQPYLNEITAFIQEYPTETSFCWENGSDYIIAEYSPLLQCTFMQIIPLKEVFSVPNQIKNFLLIYSILALGILISYGFVSFRLLRNPIQRLLGGYQQVENGVFDISLPEETSTMEFQLLFHGFNNMTAHLKKTIDQLYTYQIYSQKMELKQLQMQMSPHFLYNTYFILHRLIQQEDMEQAAMLSSYLGSYFQYITRNSMDLMPLEKEWNHAVNYLKIQEIRFSARVRIIYDSLPEKFLNYPVPRLILQPMLENALEHGMKGMPEGGIVSLHFVEQEDLIEFIICDNGKSLGPEDIETLKKDLYSSDSPNKECTAMHNVHKRLQLLYGESGKILLTPNGNTGLCVHIIIPIDKTFHQSTGLSTDRIE